MAILAIKGHPTRGKEVIEILGMLGGRNVYRYTGHEHFWFTITRGDNIDWTTKKDGSFLILEEFLAKFPYKVGDKAFAFGNKCTIIDAVWDNGIDEIIYTIKLDTSKYTTTKLSNQLQPYKEETMEIPEELMPKIDFNEYCKDKYILDLDNYEIKEENGKTYAVRKRLEYPKTYEECCEIMGIEYPVVGGKPDGLSASTYRIDEIRPFIYLLICRDAYWKIAGDEYQLGKPWEPLKSDSVYCIFRYKGDIVKDNFVFGDSLILEFPTEEMRDVFFENFKDLIEQCKELL